VRLIFRCAVLAVAALIAAGSAPAHAQQRQPAIPQGRVAPAGGTITAVQITGNVRA